VVAGSARGNDAAERRAKRLGEGVGVDECEQMIAKYDLNNDRRIDIAEFTKVLEAGIC